MKYKFKIQLFTQKNEDYFFYINRCGKIEFDYQKRGEILIVINSTKI